MKCTEVLEGVCVAVLVSLGCREPAGPPDIYPGTYVLATVAGAPLPHTLVEESSYRVSLLADTLQIRSNGASTVVQVWRRDSLPGPTFTDSIRHQWTGIVRRSADRSWLELQCQIIDICFAASQSFTLSWGEGTLAFTRPDGEYLYRAATAP